MLKFIILKILFLYRLGKTMLNNLSLIKCKIIVSSRVGVKTIENDLSQYINITEYENIIDYLKRNKRALARYLKKENGEPLTISDFMIEERVYNEFIQQFVLKDYTLSYEQIYEPFYALEIDKPNTYIALINVDASERIDKVHLCQSLLNQYGMVGTSPKYQIKKMYLSSEKVL